MTLILHDIEQGSPDWLAVRLGKPTASEFSTVLAKGEGKTRRTYMLKLAGEILRGEPMESYTNADMERGTEQEEDARDRYAFERDVDPQLVGFIEDTNLNAGCSPDALIGDDGMVEFKSAAPHIQIDRILRNRLPPEHVAQVQGNLWIARRKWIDFVSYCPKLPLFVIRVERDEDYIAKMEEAVATFNTELAETVERVRHYGQPASTVIRDQMQRSLATS